MTHVARVPRKLDGIRAHFVVFDSLIQSSASSRFKGTLVASQREPSQTLTDNQ